jgi:glycosyltransferase involved in cell wall biosynthesis
MRPVVIVPAYNAARTVVGVIAGLRAAWADSVIRRACATDANSSRPPGRSDSKVALPIIVVGDGSTDGTAAAVREPNVILVQHPENRGKGAALRTGLMAALDLGYDTALTVDADGQHPPGEAVRVLLVEADQRAIVMGVRNLGAVGAPSASIFGNRLANFSLTVLTLHRFHDTQCGLRRYPVASTLALRTRDNRFGFESEVILRAARAALPFEEVPVRCVYARKNRQPTHYRRIFDTAAIIVRMHVAYLIPWLRAPKVSARVSRPPVSLGTRARQLGSLWVGAVVLALAVVVLRTAVLWASRW